MLLTPQLHRKSYQMPVTGQKVLELIIAISNELILRKIPGQAKCIHS